DRLPCVNTPGELMNGQIRALARTVHGEIPKRDYTQVVEMRVGRAKKFACDLCGSIRAQCLGKMYILRKWDRLRRSVNRRARRKDESLHAGYTRSLKQV